MKVVARRRRLWALVSALFPAGVAVAIPILVAVGSPMTFVFAAVCILILPWLIAERTERLIVDDGGFTVSRPPLPSRVIPATEVTKVESSRRRSGWCTPPEADDPCGWC